MLHGASRIPRYTSAGLALRYSAPASPGAPTSARCEPESRPSMIAPRPRSLATERKCGMKRSSSGAAPLASTRTITFFCGAPEVAAEATDVEGDGAEAQLIDV